MQSAFVKVAERIHQFDDERPFAPWFLRIVINDALKSAKKQKRNVCEEILQCKSISGQQNKCKFISGFK